MDDLRADPFVVDFSESPGLHIQCVEGGFLAVMVRDGVQRVIGCETAGDVLECVLSYLGSPDLIFQWRVGRPICRPNTSSCILARTETRFGQPCHVITYARPEPPQVQHLSTRDRRTVLIVARWLGLSETAAETYEELDPSESDGTLGA